MAKKNRIAKPKGKLGILTPGLGAVSTTFIAGVLAARRGIGQPIGSLTQMGTIRLGKKADKRTSAIKDFVPLQALKDVVFGGWDIFEDNAYEAAVNAEVLDRRLLDELKDELETIVPMPAVFHKSYVKKLDGTNVKKWKNKMKLAEALMADMERFKKKMAVIDWSSYGAALPKSTPKKVKFISLSKNLSKV